MTGKNAKRTIEDIAEEHLAVTKAGFARLSQTLKEIPHGLARPVGFSQLDRLDDGDEPYRDHERRISALEKTFAKLKKTP